MNSAFSKSINRLTMVGFRSSWLIITPIVVGCGRNALEHIVLPIQWDSKISAEGIDLLAPYTVSSILFYHLTQVLLICALAWISRRRPAELVGPVTIGLFLAWVPPMIDSVLPPQPERYYTFFANFEWDFIARYQRWGETITVWVAITLCGVLVSFLSRTLYRGIAGLLAGYLIFQFLGWGWLATVEQIDLFAGGGRIAEGVTTQSIGFLNLTGIAFIFLFYSLARLRFLWPSLCRIHHALPFSLITAIASRMSGLPWHEAVWRGLLITFSFQLVIIVNDYFDREQDGVAGEAARPVKACDMVYASYLQVCLVLSILVFRPALFHSLLLFFAFPAAYHWPGLRLKRFLGLAYLLEGLAVGAVILIGHQDGRGAGWVPLGLALTIPGFALGCMFKDYKDIAQDRMAGVKTVYTECQARGWSIERTHACVRILLTALLLLPVGGLLLFSLPPARAAMLCMLALVPGTLLGLRDRKQAVKAAIWGINAYLMAMLLMLPRL